MSPSDERIRLSVVILCYRAEEGIIPFVESIHRMLSYCRFTYELVLVANYAQGSPDRTPQVARALEARLPHTRALALPKEGMMGWDMRAGMDAARGELVCVIDGDGQFPLESILTCLIKIETEELDLVKTYRVLREDGLYRRFISWTYNRLFRLLFKLECRDTNSKPKIMWRSIYRLMGLGSDDWFIDAEIMIRARELGLRVAEVPIHFSAIETRPSFVRPATILEFLRNLWFYRFRRQAPSAPLPSRRPEVASSAPTAP